MCEALTDMLGLNYKKSIWKMGLLKTVLIVSALTIIAAPQIILGAKKNCFKKRRGVGECRWGQFSFRSFAFTNGNEGYGWISYRNVEQTSILTEYYGDYGHEDRSQSYNGFGMALGKRSLVPLEFQ